MTAIPESGELADLPLPRLLLELSWMRFEGTLRLRRDGHEKSFRFQRGAPISAESTLASDTLGLQLVDRGVLSREDHLRVSRYVVDRNVKEGVALLELRLLTPKELFVALKEQVRARLVGCFGWPRGEFAWEREAASVDDAQPFRADLISLIQEGIETHWGADRVLADLQPHMNHVASRNRQLSRHQERLRSDEQVIALIDALDGTRTLWRALQSARTPRALAAAWVLVAIGAIDFSEARQEPEPAEAGSGDDAATPATSASPEIEIVLDEDAGVTVTASPVAASASREARGDQADLVLEISQKYVALDDDPDHYALLGVASDVEAADIRRAYLAAAKRFHPDALARADLDRETRQKAGKVFAAIGKAHAVLSDPKRRTRYDTSLTSDDTDQDAERLAAAETNFRKGEILMKSGNFRGALDFLRPAVELWPEEAAYQGAFGWSLFKATPSDPVRARNHLEHAYRIEPRSAEVAYRLSLVLKALGEGASAANLLAKARSLDPDIG